MGALFWSGVRSCVIGGSLLVWGSELSLGALFWSGVRSCVIGAVFWSEVRSCVTGGSLLVWGSELCHWGLSFGLEFGAVSLGALFWSGVRSCVVSCKCSIHLGAAVLDRESKTGDGLLLLACILTPILPRVMVVFDA